MDSPFAGHRIPTLEYALAQALRRDVTIIGEGVEELAGILRLAQLAAPLVTVLEDRRPADPRLPAIVPFAERCWRIHPGWSDRPIDRLEETREAALVIDRQCSEQYGFRSSDLVELGLRYADAAVTHMAPSWPVGPVVAALTAAEVDAACGWWARDRLAEQVEECIDPAAAGRALDWATYVDVDEPVSCTAPQRSSALQGCLAIVSDGVRWAMPASVVLDRLAECVTLLDAAVAST
jgi:hypothetical protein